MKGWQAGNLLYEQNGEWVEIAIVWVAPNDAPEGSEMSEKVSVFEILALTMIWFDLLTLFHDEQ